MSRNCFLNSNVFVFFGLFFYWMTHPPPSPRHISPLPTVFPPKSLIPPRLSYFSFVFLDSFFFMTPAMLRTRAHKRRKTKPDLKMHRRLIACCCRVSKRLHPENRWIPWCHNKCGAGVQRMTRDPFIMDPHGPFHSETTSLCPTPNTRCVPHSEILKYCNEAMGGVVTEQTRGEMSTPTRFLWFLDLPPSRLRGT